MQGRRGIPSICCSLPIRQQGNAVFVCGIFPIRDAAGNTVGAMFVVRDISRFYLAMKHTQNVLIGVTVAAWLLVTLLVLFLLNSLVFRRLDRIMVAATRVVGGDYHTPLKVNQMSKWAKLEELFEQFRRFSWTC
jgi:signal transduction histidine kinase